MLELTPFFRFFINLGLGTVPLFNLRVVIASFIIAAPSISLAFDLGTLGTVINIFNNAQSATPRKNYSPENLVAYLANKVDNGNEVSVKESTRKERFIARFDGALADSGLTPSHKEQFTSPVKIAQDETTFYEIWGFYVYNSADPGGAEQMSIARYFLICDKGLIGQPGAAHYNMIDGVRTIDKVFLYNIASIAKEYRRLAKAPYEAVCKPTAQKQESEIIEEKPEASVSPGT